VAADRAKPFRVRVKNQTIEVLGTEFNVNAYDDEAVIRTTLAEGAVRVRVGGAAEAGATEGGVAGAGKTGAAGGKGGGGGASGASGATGAASLVLKPGEQAQVNASGGLTLVKDPDMEETLAWKEGLFDFNGADIGTIMRAVARWYGVDIVYKDKITEEFVAEIPRTVPVSQLLLLLEATRQVHFTIEGKTITVTK